MKIAVHVLLYLFLIQIDLFGQTKADFSSDKVSGCGVLQTNFQSLSTGNIVSYHWTFGYGSNAATMNPQKIFASPGKYTVCLTVVDNNGQRDSICKQDYITLYNGYQANFKVDDSVICAGSQIGFTDITTSPNGAIVKWVWDLSGSSGLIEQSSPGKVFSKYTLGGNYTISLSTTDIGGCVSTVSKKALKVIDKPKISVDFGSGIICDTIGTITITNKSPKIPGISYIWDFGRNIIFNSYDPPSLIFTGEGKYPVKVIALNTANNCNDTSLFNDAITVENLSKFTLPRKEACLNEVLNFKLGATLVAENHVWDFGDGTISLDPNPSHTYTKAGCFKVSHKIQNKGCSSETVSNECITIHDLPEPNFTLDKTRGCTFPLEVQATNTSIGATSYSWLANGQELSTDINPLLKFTTEGQFKISLVVKSAFGCTKILENSIVDAYRLKASIVNGTKTGCAPASIPFEQMSITKDPITSVRWTIYTPVPKEANTLSIFQPFISDVGSFHVKLVVENSLGCVDSVIYNDLVQLGQKPVTAMDLPKSVCYKQPIVARDASSNFANRFEWSIQPGGQSYSTKDATFEFSNLVTQTIIHRAWQYGCPGDEIRDTVQTIGAKADFEAVLDCNEPFKRAFINKSTGSDSIHWDFGVNSILSDTSTLFDPTYVFPGRNDYNVLLEVFNLGSGCASDSFSIKLPIRKIKSSFAISLKEACAPADLLITNTSTDAVSYNYFFPGSDQVNFNVAAPTLRFSKGGITGGRLITSDELGCKDTATIDSINIHQVISNLVAERKIFCQDSLLSFLDKSVAVNDSIVHNNWTFFNKNINDANKVSLTLDRINTPFIQLKVDSKYGCSDTKNEKLTINKLTATAIADTLSCTREQIPFLPTIAGEWTNVKWNFGDGSVSEEYNPIHQFKQEGQYFVGFTVNDSNSGCVLQVDSIVKVKIGEPKAGFMFQGASTNCHPFAARFENLSTNAYRFIWDLGDQTNVNTEINPSHLYVDRGFYSIRLIAGSTLHCLDTLLLDSLIQVDGPIVKKVSIIDPIYCVPSSINFTAEVFGKSAALIDWGDGTQNEYTSVEGELNLDHQYKSEGQFLPVIVVTDTNKCLDFAIFETINAHEVKADIKVRDSLLCGFNSVQTFIDSTFSTSPLNQIKFRLYSLAFDTTFTMVPIDFPLANKGTYSIDYSISDDICSDSLFLPNSFALYPDPAASFTINKNVFCEGDSILLINQSRSPDLRIDTIFWDIGGLRSLKDSVNAFLEKEGIKKISLIARNEAGCRDTIVQNVEIKGSVFAIANRDTTICDGSLVKLSSTILNPIAGMKYQWITDTSTLCSACNSVNIRPSATETFIFQTIHPSGCTRDETVNVKVFKNNIGALGINADTTICAGDYVLLSVDAKDNLFVYHWDSTALGLTCYNFCRNPIAIPVTTTQYKVQVVNDLGCERYDSVLISVQPKIDFDLGSDRTLCIGDTFSINIPGMTQARWSGSNGISCTNCANPVLKPIGDSKYRVQGVIQGCQVMDSIKIKLLSNALFGLGNDTAICQGSAVKLAANFSPTIWSPTVSLNDPTLNNPIATPVRSITYIAKYTEDLCNLIDSIRIHVLAKTDIMGRDWTVCPKDELELEAEGVASKYEWSGPNILTETNKPSITILTKNSAQYRLIASNQTCAPDTAFFNITAIDFINLKDTIHYTVIPGLPFQLNRGLNNLKKYKFEWSPPNNLTCSDCASPIFQGEIDQEYSFKIIDPVTGCELNQLVQLTMSTSCDPKDYFAVPNVFTPNHDGINDILFIIPKSSDQIKSYRIYDRTGILVFQTFDINIGWDGTFKNKPAPQGVYIYIVEAICPANAKPILLKGDVTLLR
ncbi:MAG: PKD domain-containing protein [Saprospiraceae bacterium]